MKWIQLPIEGGGPTVSILPFGKGCLVRVVEYLAVGRELKTVFYCGDIQCLKQI